MEQIHYHVFEGPSSLSGRLLQVVFLVTLLGAVPATAFGAGVAAWVRGGGAGARRLPGAMAWTAYLFPALGFVSSGLVIYLFVSEVDIEALPKERVGFFRSSRWCRADQYGGRPRRSPQLAQSGNPGEKRP